VGAVWGGVYVDVVGKDVLIVTVEAGSGPPAGPGEIISARRLNVCG
jgi:hypothetical protein